MSLKAYLLRVEISWRGYLAVAVSAEGDREMELTERVRMGSVAVLPGILETALVGELLEAFLPLIDQQAAIAEANRGTRRHQMYVPFVPPFSDSRVWGNSTVLDVVGGVLGKDFDCIYYASDTPLPGSGYQPIHQDCSPLYRDWGVRLPSFCVVANIPLVDVNHQNGPLEWFPGFERPGVEAVPRRFTGPAGTVLLRDPRVWHRGSPNLSKRPRPTLALIFARSWYRYHLDRPVINRTVYDDLPEVGQRLFKSAEILPSYRVVADGPAEFD